MDLQSELILTSAQIELVEPGLKPAEIESRIMESHWLLVWRGKQDGITAYHLKENRFCSCGKPAIHFHNGNLPCCGEGNCCPEFSEDDPDLEFARLVASVREKVEKRKGMLRKAEIK